MLSIFDARRRAADIGANESISYDAVVIGAGFSGLYMLYKLRTLGFSVRCVEKGAGVGGTWYWNRYPGARVDVQSIEYSYSFSDEIQQEYEWTDVMSCQADVEKYLNFVADRLDLRRDIWFERTVTTLRFDEPAAGWFVETDHGEHFFARFVVAATGCLSEPIEPDIVGLDTFGGQTLYTNRFPAEGFDFADRRVGVIGTGSSGVQSIPVIAESARELYVFQRSAAYTQPALARPLIPGELDEAKKNYPAIRARERTARGGVIWIAAVERDIDPPDRKIVDASEEERKRVLDELGWEAPLAWSDVLSDPAANAAAKALYAELVRRVVHDPETAASLVPHYPMGCKRPVFDTGYFASFNRPSVHLVDLRKGAIISIDPAGVETHQGRFDLDVLVLATGFDAITGALDRIAIHGRDDRSLRSAWHTGPVTYLGLVTPGFPNLFTITGPGSPSVLTNMVVAIEQHVEWIAKCIAFVSERGLQTIDPTEEAARDWTHHVNTLAASSNWTAEGCTSWYLGDNVPGKVRVFTPYTGGLPRYRDHCDQVAREGYPGFEFTP